MRSETKREAFFAVVWNDGTYWLYPSGESGNLGFMVHPGPYNVEQFALYARNDGVGCVRNVNDNTFYEVDFKTGTVGNVVRTGSGLRVVWNGEEWLFERFRTGPCVSGTRGYWEDAAGQALGFSVNADRDYFRGMAVSEDRARAWVQRTFSGSDNVLHETSIAPPSCDQPVSWVPLLGSKTLAWLDGALYGATIEGIWRLYQDASPELVVPQSWTADDIDFLFASGSFLWNILGNGTLIKIDPTAGTVEAIETLSGYIVHVVVFS